jgi:hypothetical protein
MSGRCADPELLARMIAFQANGWSYLEIAREVGLTRNQVMGRLARVRAKVPPSAFAEAAARQAPTDAARGQVRLVAGSTKERGAYLDAAILKRRSYVAALRDEGGHSSGPTASLHEGQL